MPQRNFNQKFLEAVKTERRTEEFYDLGFKSGGSLVLVVTSSGSKTFFWRGRVKGDSRLWRVKLGGYPDLKVGEARDQASDRARDAAKGITPVQRAAESKTFGQAFREYLDATAGKRSADYNEAMWRRYLTRFEHRPLLEIRRGDILALRDDMLKKGIQSAARRTITLVRSFFNWCLDEEKLPEDHPHPCNRVTVAKDNKRTRVLSDTELRSLWLELDKSESAGHGVFKLQLLTACRIGEARTMRREDVDLEASLWIKPAERMKAGEEHRVPLSAAALALVKRRLEMAQTIGSPWVFFSANRPQKPACVTDALLRKTATAAKIKGIRPHDLRRTVSNRMAEMGIPLHVIGHVLSHAQGSENVTEKHYIPHSFLPEMRAALERWAARLEQILTSEPAKVVRMAR